MFFNARVNSPLMNMDPSTLRTGSLWSGSSSDGWYLTDVPEPPKKAPFSCHGNVGSMACHLIDPDARQDALAAAQRLKMARSAHAYVRGNTADFYDWLRHLKRGHLPEGPPVWICGDCHAGNLGPLAHSDGRVEIQIRDLDQTVIGNPTHDLIRLGLSLASAARGSYLPGVTTAHILEQMIEGFAGAMELGRTSGDVDELPEEMRVAVKTARRRSWQHLAKERIKNTKPSYLWVKVFGPWLPKSEPKSRVCSKEKMFANSLPCCALAKTMRR